MASVVIQLQQEALDAKVPVSDLLRKALVVARKLGQREFQTWIEQELNGYAGTKDAPGYREVKGQVRGWNPYRGWIPLIFEDAAVGEKLSRRKSSQSIAELEHLVGKGKEGMLHMPFPLEMQRELSKGFGFETEVSLLTTRSSMVGVIDTVRTIVLNWALKLEEEGILGEGLSFTEGERQKAGRSSQNITNFYGPVQGPQVLQGGDNAVQIAVSLKLDTAAVGAFVEALKAALPELQLSAPLKSEVQAELATLESQLKSPKPKSGILSESLRSVRTILEGAGGGVAGQLLIELGKILF